MLLSLELPEETVHLVTRMVAAMDGPQDSSHKYFFDSFDALRRACASCGNPKALTLLKKALQEYIASLSC
jgi:hypothetical protein